MELISVNDLSMQFGHHRALDSVDFTVHSGVTGLVGANGAGKTTFMSIALGLRAPTIGSIRVLDLEPVAVVSVCVDASARGGVLVVHHADGAAKSRAEAKGFESVVEVLEGAPVKCLLHVKEEHEPFSVKGLVVDPRLDEVG